MKLNNYLERRIAKGVVALMLGGAALIHTLHAEESRETRTIERDGIVSRIEVLGDPFGQEVSRPVMDQGRIIFYRPVTAAANNAASIFLNDSYHASLTAGGYSPICLQPANFRVGVRKVKVGDVVRGGQDAVTTVTLKRGQTLFMRVEELEGGRWRLQPVADAEALGELGRTRLQIHTLSRVEAGEECRLGEQAESQRVVFETPRRQIFSGDALFQYAHTSLSRRGMAELDGMIAQLRQDYESIDRVSVYGYTDPLGKNHLAISRGRADSVLNYFLSHGLQARETFAEGRGAADLVVKNCGNQPTPEVIACNQPNRRVVVEVAGKRR